MKVDFSKVVELSHRMIPREELDRIDTKILEQFYDNGVIE